MSESCLQSPTGHHTPAQIRLDGYENYCHLVPRCAQSLRLRTTSSSSLWSLLRFCSTHPPAHYQIRDSVENDSWRNIPITLKIPRFGYQPIRAALPTPSARPSSNYYI